MCISTSAGLTCGSSAVTYMGSAAAMCEFPGSSWWLPAIRSSTSQWIGVMNLMDLFQVSSRLSRGLPRTFNVTLYLAILCGIVSFKLCAVCRCHAPFPSHLGLFLDTRLQPSYAFSSHFSSNFLHPEPDLGNIVDKLSIRPRRHLDSNPRGDLGQDKVMISFKVVFMYVLLYLSGLECMLLQW